MSLTFAIGTSLLALTSFVMGVGAAATVRAFVLFVRAESQNED